MNFFFGKKIRCNNEFHHRNIHVLDNFLLLSFGYPELIDCIKINNGKVHINYDNPRAIYKISKVLLHYRYKITWKIPRGFLVPTIPSRVNYVHYIADLLTPEHIFNTEETKGLFSKTCLPHKTGIKHETEFCSVKTYLIPTGRQIFGLDIGVGANCIFPILCNSIYSWSMVGTDISTESLFISNSIIEINNLSDSIKLIHQKNVDQILVGILDHPKISNTYFAFSICNPPFYSSNEDSINSTHPNRSRSCKEYEVITIGGEFNFLLKLYKQSKNFQKRVIWFTSQVSKLKNIKKLREIFRYELCSKKLEATRIISLKQGKHEKWVLAWSFYNKEERISLLKFLRCN
ncbi:YbiN-like RNA methylase [Cryptosporidium ryanae]|uniref:YbiN-like RNA methylase n=1 Tax=Cryptosporidium ryanae TaxID=515981 RepID=UPI00351A788E|nr:YbiN-like RNA methylase [Cryptosporidium ryanae]